VTAEEIVRLRWLCEAATPAPWTWTDNSFLWNVESDRSVLAHGELVMWKVSDVDREFIVAIRFRRGRMARVALPALLDAIERLKAARDEACDMLIAIDHRDSLGAERIVRVHELRKVESP
jgi:hypothetical protein